MRQKILYTVIFFFLSINYINAQFNSNIGSIQNGAGGTGLVMNDVWSNYHNQAGLGGIKGYAAGLYYTRLFNSEDMATTAFAAAVPVSKIGAFGLNYSHFGYDLFSQSKFGLAYGMKLGKRFYAGVQIDYLLTKQGLNYGNSGNVTGEIGIIAEPIENFRIAAHVFNIWGAKYNDYATENIPTIFKLGLGYNFSDKLLLMIEGEKDIEMPVVLRAGFNYNVIKGLYFRAGVSGKPVEYSFGVGYEFKGIKIDAAFIHHEILGIYPNFTLSYMFVKE